MPPPLPVPVEADPEPPDSDVPALCELLPLFVLPLALLLRGKKLPQPGILPRGLRGKGDGEEKKEG